MLSYLVPAGWILFDVLICLRTGYMTGPFPQNEWWMWLISGLALAGLSIFAQWREGKKHETEMSNLKNQLTEQKDQLTEQRGINLGAAMVIGRRLDDIANRVSDPQSKADISELREEVVRKPVIVYECFDEGAYAWKSTGEKYNYVHLWFRNESTGGIAHDAAAKLSWWDIRYTDQQPLFSVDGKWYEVSPELGKRAQVENTINLLPNRASHGLDLLVRKPGTDDWSYGLDVSSSIDERRHLRPGIYKVRVTISCEGYSKDFYFRVATGVVISVHEYVSPDGEGQEVRNAAQR